MDGNILASLLIADGFWHSVGRNWAAISITLTCLSLVVFVALVLNKYVRICLNIFTDTHPPLAMGPLDYQKIIGEEVQFNSFDGSVLRGMWLWTPKALPRRGTIIFCHEFKADMFSCARYVRPLMKAGFNIFSFDFRGHGESSCPERYIPLQWPSDKDLEDVLGASAYVYNRLQSDGQDNPIGVFGISRGAGAAILAAERDENIKAILCDGAFSTDKTLISLMKRWAYIFAKVKLVYENHPPAFWRLLQWMLIRAAQPRMGCKYPSVRKALREMAPRPIMLIHGQRDSYIRQEQTHLLHAIAPPPKYVWIVPDARHNQSVVVQPEQYARRTTAFFLRHLAGEHIDDQLIAGDDGDASCSEVA